MNEYKTAVSWGPAVDLGADDDRTCFLQGISGDVQSTYNGPSAGGRVYQSGGHWWLRAYAGTGAGVKAHAACVAYTYGRQTLSWPGNSGNGSSYTENKAWIPEGGTSMFTKCFLTSVLVTTGFETSWAFVKLQREHIWWNGSDFDTWTLGGNLAREQDNSAGGGASAVCLELWNDSYPYSWQVSGAGAKSSSIGLTSQLACGIHKLVGQFASNGNGGSNDGVKIEMNNGNWQLFSSGSKQIAGECYAKPQL